MKNNSSWKLNWTIASIIHKLKTLRWQNYHRRYLPWLVAVGFGLAWLLGQVQLQANTTSVMQAQVTDILKGKQVYIQNRLVQMNAVAKRGEQVRTAQARVELRFNTGAIARLSENASLLVGSQCAEVQTGTILVNGAVNSCTPSIVAGVRGTTYLLRVDRAGEEDLTVIEGEVEISSRSLDNRHQQNFQPFRLKAGQKAGFRQGRLARAVCQLSRQEFEQILMDQAMGDYRNDLPGYVKIRQSFERLYPGARFPERRRSRFISITTF